MLSKVQDNLDYIVKFEASLRYKWTVCQERKGKEMRAWVDVYSPYQC